MQTTTTFQQKLVKQIDLMEAQLLKIRWELSRGQISDIIIRKTAGILGDKFPTGLEYQKKVRKDWDDRFAKLAL